MRRLTRSLARCFTTTFEAFARPSLYMTGAPVNTKLPDNRLHQGVTRITYLRTSAQMLVLAAAGLTMRRSRQTQFQAPGASWNGASWQASVRQGVIGCSRRLSAVAGSHTIDHSAGLRVRQKLENSQCAAAPPMLDSVVTSLA